MLNVMLGLFCILLGCVSEGVFSSWMGVLIVLDDVVMLLKFVCMRVVLVVCWLFVMLMVLLSILMCVVVLLVVL